MAVRASAMLLAAAVLLAGLTACSAGQAAQAEAAELLSLGEQYLTDLDYDRALVQFLKVIEIEPRNVRAYLGAAEAYIALGQTEEALAVLRQGLEENPDDASVRARLTELLMTPHRFSAERGGGVTAVIFGQTDIEGRLQGFCIINEYGPDGGLRYLAEGEFKDDRPAEIRNWWRPDENTNRQYGVDTACGFGTGLYQNGQRYGYAEIRCYTDCAVNAAEGEMIRREDITGIGLVYNYKGIMIDDATKEDSSGTAYEMYVDGGGYTVEYTGGFRGNERSGYGRMQSTEGWVREGQWLNGEPAD